MSRNVPVRHLDDGFRLRFGGCWVVSEHPMPDIDGKVAHIRPRWLEDGATALCGEAARSQTYTHPDIDDMCGRCVEVARTLPDLPPGGYVKIDGQRMTIAQYRAWLDEAAAR